VLLITFLLAGALVAASSVLRVQRPEDGGARDATSDVLVPPLLPPPGALVYWRVDPPTAAQETGRALAYLPQPPTGLDEPVEVALPALSALSEGEVAIRTNALVHYQGGGHSVFIALDEASATIAQQQRLLLGQRTVQLADGREAWASFRPQWPESNVVTTAMDRFLVVVASDLPAPMVQSLAGQVTLVPGRPAPGAAAPAPATDLARAVAHPAPDPGGLTIALGGTTEVWQDRLGPVTFDRWHLRYRFDLGLRGTAGVQDVEVPIEWPEALAARATEAPPVHRFGSLSGGATLGGGGDVTFATGGLDGDVVRAELARGLSVRVRWSERGEQHEQIFTLP
jgi:hypothetical protein